MSKPRGKGLSFAKVVAGFAALFGIGFGLCGLSMILPSSDREFHTDWLSLPSLLLMVVSFFGLIATLAAWVIASTAGGFSRKQSGAQTLFGDSDEKASDKEERQ